MSGPNGENCKECYFSELYDEEGGYYSCHRYPPSITPEDADANVFEVVQIDVSPQNWCGEFKRQESLSSQDS